MSEFSLKSVTFEQVVARGTRATDRKALKRREKGLFRHERIFLSREEGVSQRLPMTKSREAFR